MQVCRYLVAFVASQFGLASPIEAARLGVGADGWQMEGVRQTRQTGPGGVNKRPAALLLQIPVSVGPS